MVKLSDVWDWKDSACAGNLQRLATEAGLPSAEPHTLMSQLVQTPFVKDATIDNTFLANLRRQIATAMFKKNPEDAISVTIRVSLSKE